MLKYLRDSRALCPLTLQEVRGNILEEDGCIFLKKSPLGDTRYLLEKNADFYKQIGIRYKKQKKVFNRIMIDVTTRCNLECPVCYRLPYSSGDIDLGILRALSGEWSGKIISICGGEPTVREDLPEIIAMFSRKNTVFLISNGVRLADIAYLKDLKKRGLRYVSLSLSALSEESLSKINGEGLLLRKLSALDNLAKTGMEVVLATVLVRGINEKELKGILGLCLEYRRCIRELRIRTMAPLGAHLDRKKFFLSEMVDTVAKELNLDTEDLLKEFRLKKTANELFGEEVFTIKSCSFDFHLKLKNGKIRPVVSGLSVRVPERQPLFIRRISILILFLKIYGIVMIWKGILKLVFKKQALPWVHPAGIMKIGLRSWPDIHTIDMEENDRCSTGYWMNGEILSFCHANIIKESRSKQSR